MIPSVHPDLMASGHHLRRQPGCPDQHAAEHDARRKLGFQILAHINDKARVSPPHDHGASWAIYGQATHYTDMTEWEREDNGGDEAHVKLKPVKKYRLTPGKAGIYQDGKIHSIDYPDYARFIRVTGTNLDDSFSLSKSGNAASGQITGNLSVNLGVATGPAGDSAPPRLYLSAGIHGDEISGPLALLEMILVSSPGWR